MSAGLPLGESEQEGDSETTQPQQAHTAVGAGSDGVAVVMLQRPRATAFCSFALEIANSYNMGNTAGPPAPSHCCVREVNSQ